MQEDFEIYLIVRSNDKKQKEKKKDDKNIFETFRIVILNCACDVILKV